MPERGTKTSTVRVVCARFGIFLAQSKWFPVGIVDHGRNLNVSVWAGDKTTISGVAAYLLTSPQKFRLQKSAGKFWPRLFRIKTAAYSLIIFHRTKLSTRNFTQICWCKWRTFWRKKPREFQQGDLVLARKCPSSTGTCNPEETLLPLLPVSWSSTYSLDMTPSDNHLFAGLKNQLKFRNFTSHDVIAVAET